jgi:hypoxanthine-DNA glycosylase
MSLEVRHPFEPVYNERSRVLILGTMPSPASRKLGFYYMHAQNRFWPVLCAVFGAAVPPSIALKRAFILENRLALWDVLSSCEISGAKDSSITNARANDIPALLQTSGITKILCTGSRAAHHYKALCREKTGVDAARLPSTSAANRRVSMEELVEAYKAALLP